MRKTVKKEVVAKAEKLSELVTARRAIEKQEKELKDYFKSLLLDDSTLQAGDYLISLDDCSRSNWDTGLLSEFLGDKKDEFKTVTNYKKFNIKKVA